MNLLAAAGAAGSPVRKIVLKSSTLVYGSNYQDPYFFREDDAAHATRRSTRVERSLLEVASFVRDFAEDNPRRDRHASCGSPTCSAHDIDSAFSRAPAHARRPRDPRLRPAPAVRARGRRHRRARCTRRCATCPASTTSPATGVLPWSEVCAIVGKRRVALPPAAHRLVRRAAPARAGRRHAARSCSSLLRYGRAVDTSRSSAAGFRYQYTTRRDRRGVRRQPPTRTQRRREPAVVPVRARRRGVLPPLAVRRARRRREPADRAGPTGGG